MLKMYANNVQLKDRVLFYYPEHGSGKLVQRCVDVSAIKVPQNNEQITIVGRDYFRNGEYRSFRLNRLEKINLIEKS